MRKYGRAACIGMLFCLLLCSAGCLTQSESKETLTVSIEDPSLADGVGCCVKSATVSTSVNDGISEIVVTVTPSAQETATYILYWSRGDARLDGYMPLATVTYEGAEPFTVAMNKCLFMPEEADGIEVSVQNEKSASVYVPMSDALKLPESKLLYAFQVISDLHISAAKPQYSAHLTQALQDIAQISPDSAAIFVVGDNTDSGLQEQYCLLDEIIADADADLPPFYYAIGNHDMIYGADYDEQVQMFTENLGAPSVYYAGDIADTRYIVLGSDSIVGEGTIGEEQLTFLKSELEKTQREKPVFLFLHQPLIDTVSGSLYSLDPQVQYWYGIIPTGDRVRAILKNYPNAILFTGHTHWAFEMCQPLLFGEGADATYANAASVAYLWSDDNTAIDGSEGYYIQVYEDYVLLRGREFAQSKWCAAAQFMIPLYDEQGKVMVDSNRMGAKLWAYAVCVGCIVAVGVLVNKKKRSTAKT